MAKIGRPGRQADLSATYPLFHEASANHLRKCNVFFHKDQYMSLLS